MPKKITEQSVTQTLLTFCLPYLLSYFLQTLYGMADLYLIGQFDTAAGTTAVSIGSQVMHVLTVIIVGLAMGATVTVGHTVGAGEQKETASAIGNTSTLFLSLSIVLTAVLLCLTRPIAVLLSTPAEAMEGTIQYLRICFAGIPFITAYNIISSVFRGLGDTKSPLRFVAIACAANIGLDIFFMGRLALGPTGAALGTTISQGISVLAALLAIRRGCFGVVLKKSDFLPRRAMMGRILRIGVPVALQDGFVQVAFIIITLLANRRGLIDAAAVGIVEKVIGFLFLVPSAMLSTVSALGAQCIGAGRPDRAVLTLRSALTIAVGFGVAVTVIVQFTAVNIVGLFTPDTAVAAAGGPYLQGYILDCVFAGIHFCFSGYFCALGKSEISFLHNVAALLLVRIPGVYLTSTRFPDTLFPMGLATAAGSLCSVLICLAAFFLLEKKRRQQKEGLA